jgi:hypothetical protein
MTAEYGSMIEIAFQDTKIMGSLVKITHKVHENMRKKVSHYFLQYKNASFMLYNILYACL